MRIAIEARAVSSSMGVRTYTLELLRGLTRQGSNEVHAWYDHKRHLGTVQGIVEHVLPLHSELQLLPWLAWQLPRAMQVIKPDLVHFTKAAVPRRKIAPTVVTIYDVIPLLLPQSQSSLRRLYWPSALRQAAKMSDHILTISEQSKQDIVARLGVEAAKVTVTPLAIDHGHFHPVSTDEVVRVKTIYNLVQPYLLCVGTLELRKNIPTLIRAFTKHAKEMTHDLVIVGKRGWQHQAVLEAIAASGLRHRIRVLEAVPYDHLPGLYSGAEVFVWPSAYEGWGLPPLEAMACGAPVLVSNGGSLPEVVGEAGVIVPFSETALLQRLQDTQFEQHLGEALVHLVHDEPLRRRLSDAGLQRAQHFSWDEVVTRTLGVYHLVHQKNV